MDSTDNAKGAFLPSVINRIERCSPVSSQIVEKNLLPLSFRGPFSSFLFLGRYCKRDDLAGRPMIRPKRLPIEGE